MVVRHDVYNGGKVGVSMGIIMFEKNNRILEVFYRLLQGEEISIKQLANYYEVSSKTISRDLGVIMDFLAENRELMGNAELCYSHKNKTHRLECSSRGTAQKADWKGRDSEVQLGKRLDIRLLCKKEAAQVVLEYFPEVRVVGTSLIGKSKILETKVAMGEELIRTLLSFGSQVKVLGPEEVVGELGEEIRRLGRAYGVMGRDGKR